MKQCGADVAVVIAWAYFGFRHIEAPKLGCINVHASLYPNTVVRHRFIGAAIEENQTGVCTMQMDEGMDTGDVPCAVKPISPDSETTAELWDRLANMGADLLVDIGHLNNQPNPQDHNNATYAPLIQITRSYRLGKVRYSTSH